MKKFPLSFLVLLRRWQWIAHLQAVTSQRAARFILAVTFSIFVFVVHTCKSRYYGHTNSFIHEKKRHRIKQKSLGIEKEEHKFQTVVAYYWQNRTIRGCIGNLCLTEKYHILTSKSKNLLDSKNELVSKCKHLHKFLLKNFLCKPYG